MPVRSVRDLDVRGKRVLVRVDFNVPLNANGTVIDDTRLSASLPTIRLLLERGASAVLMSHLGRPKGRPDPSLSLRPVATHLAELLGRNVQFAADCVGRRTEELARSLQPGEVLLLENLRFHAEEERNDVEFARRLARLGDLYVNDAFGTAHRAHASTEAVAHLLPSAAGLLMQRELDVLRSILDRPKRPFAAVIGGSKVSSKIGVLEHLQARLDVLVLGGGMANTFLKAEGYAIGSSLAENDQVDVARNVLRQARRRQVKVILPVDVVIADRFAADAAHKVVDIGETPAGWSILDVGPKSVEAIGAALRGCATILWNGPLGVFEFPAFASGTLAVAHRLAQAEGATTVVGGGESVAAVDQAGVASKITHVSTGGGATLELLEGKTLPGVAALEQG